MKLFNRLFQDNAFISFQITNYVVKMIKTMKISLFVLISGLLVVTLPIGALAEEYSTATTSAISYLERIDPENPYLFLAKDTESTDPQTSLNLALKGIIESDKGLKEENLNKAFEIMSSLQLIPEDRKDMFNILMIESNLTRAQITMRDSKENQNMRLLFASEELLIQTTEELAEINENGLSETMSQLKRISEYHIDLSSGYSNLYKDMALISYEENRYLASTLFSIYAKNDNRVFNESVEDILTRFENDWNSFFGTDVYKDTPFGPDSLKELQNKAEEYSEEGNEAFAYVITDYIKFQAMSYTEFINAIEEGGL